MQKWQWDWRSPAGVTVVGFVAWGLLCCSVASAQSTSSGVAWADDATATRQAYYQEVGDDSPFEEEAPVAPMAETAEPPPPPDAAYDSPSDAPPPPEAPGEAGNAWVEDTLEQSAVGNRCGSCDTCGGSSYCEPSRCAGGGCGGGLGITFGGWLDQGITVNGRRVADRFNGPVTFNDRDGEYQMNQLWLYAEKEVDTGGYGWDVGGRIDAVYGTDWRFTSSIGLEDDWNESERFYGVAVPQAYVDVAVNDLTVRMGHFYTIIGYEVVTAPDNFFYSHAYTFQYGEPFTHTGLLASHAVSDQIAISGGFDRGWDTWEDNNTDLEFLGGISWTSCDESTSVAFGLTSGAYDDAGDLNRTMYSVVLSHRINCRWRYVLQHDYGIDDDGSLRNPLTGATPDAEWYGVNQYLFYDVNECWSVGARVEWFRDDDGTRVGGIGAPGGWTLGPNKAANQQGWAGDFSAVTIGLNWKPTDWINVRPECRWDWYDGPADGLGRLPYDAGSRDNQFTFGTDLIVVF